MIISFGWTAQYLPPDGPKDTTRRIWKPKTLATWQRAWDNGRYEHDAVDKCLAYGGNRIGKIILMERPFLEPIAQMQPVELLREGGMCNTVDEFIDRYFKGDRTLCPAVVRFRFTPNLEFLRRAA
jgi:hypothetical protein